SAGWSLSLAASAVSGVADDDVWIAAGAEVAHFDGSSWRRWQVPAGSSALGVVARGPAEAWISIAGDRDAVVHVRPGEFVPHALPYAPVEIAAHEGEVLVGTKKGVLAGGDRGFGVLK